MHGPGPGTQRGELGTLLSPSQTESSHRGIADFNGIDMKNRKREPAVPRPAALVNRAAKFSLCRRLLENICICSLEAGSVSAADKPVSVLYLYFVRL